MTFLIVYEEVPENTYLYRVDTDDPDLIAAIRACHGKFANVVDCPPEVEATINRMHVLGTKLYDSTSAESPPIVIGRLQIIVTGFIL